MQASINRELTTRESIQQRVDRAYQFADLSDYSFTERLKIRLADLVFYLLINLIGLTARFEVVGWENHDKAEANGGLPIYVFWHDRIFLTTYWWRKRRIVVMTSRSFDGEYIARFIQRFGYGAVRGSSTRGGVGRNYRNGPLDARGMHDSVHNRWSKRSPLCSQDGCRAFSQEDWTSNHACNDGMGNYWTVSSWDKFQIPKPFTKARVYVAPPIYVPRRLMKMCMNAKRDELQAILDTSPEMW
jgi:lysophospholipid acyltransferase (LPLAT)-like uncharacterized protein